MVQTNTVGSAVFLAIYGIPYGVFAQDSGAISTTSGTADLQEVVVTANRREQKLEEVPYSLTVFTGDDIARTGVTDFASLANQIPGLSFYDFGARNSASTVPVIRGLDASGAPGGFRTFEQSPVGTYIGNSPIDGYFQLDDVQQVEVLRGPQGTLYGAGALGGAVRIIPNAPELGQFSGHVDLSAGSMAHASKPAYTMGAVINLPIGDTLALRLSGKYAYEPGFIDAYGFLQRTGTQLNGLPVLADPADPVNSSGIFSGKNDWNHQNTFTGRASLLWKPTERFSADAAFLYANVNGQGGPSVNTSFPGGAYPIDPRITFPGGGDYQTFSAIDQPFYRRTALESLDLSFDAGFATLSSTTSYYTVNGMTSNDATLLGGYPGFASYYAGNPVNPRYVGVDQYADSSHTFTQEVRLVSVTGPDNRFDYVLGAFYEKQTRVGSWNRVSPGTYERSVQQGCTGAYYYGANFPDCLVTVGPNDTNFSQVDTQNFEDKSIFGELTWHFAPHAQITFGGRHFKQNFTDAQSYQLYTFDLFVPPVPVSSPASKNTWKVNPSYEYTDGHFVYAMWSQGFRRGGANALPTVGIAKESPQLDSYAPDFVNNYEIGAKGRFANGTSYSLALFDIHWNNPQIGGTLPSGNLAVFNAQSALSKGVEFEIKGPLWVPGVTYSVGGAYADATLSSGYSLPANNGTGTIVPGLLTADAGDQLPGSPKLSGAATLTYDRVLMPDYELSVSINETYRSRVQLNLSSSESALASAPFAIGNLSATLNHRPWKLTAYVTNFLDKREIYSPYLVRSYVIDGHLYDDDVVNRPREAGLRIAYAF